MFTTVTPPSPISPSRHSANIWHWSQEGECVSVCVNIHENAKCKCVWMNSLSLPNDVHSGANNTPVHTVDLLVVLVGLTEEFLSVCVCVCAHASPRACERFCFSVGPRLTPMEAVIYQRRQRGSHLAAITHIPQPSSKGLQSPTQVQGRCSMWTSWGGVASGRKGGPAESIFQLHPPPNTAMCSVFLKLMLILQNFLLLLKLSDKDSVFIEPGMQQSTIKAYFSHKTSCLLQILSTKTPFFCRSIKFFLTNITWMSCIEQNQHHPILSTINSQILK